MNKFTAQLGNDAVIRVYFFDTEGQIDVEGNVPYDLSKAQDIVVELVNQFRKRTKMSYKIEAPNVLVIELPVELQKIGNYFLEVLFQVPNEALADGLQAYRLRLDGVSIVEAGAVSGQVGATFGVVDPNTPTRAALLAQIETLTTERDNAKEAQAQAEEGKTTAETERDQAVRDKTAADEAKAQAEKERDTAKEAQATAERDKTQAEAERDQARQDKAAADEAKAQAEQERDTAKEAQAQAEEGKTTAEAERDQAVRDKAAADEAKAQAEQERDTAKEAQAQAEEGKTTAEAERDQAVRDKAAADEAKAQAEQERDTAKEAQAQADEAKAQAEQERDTAKEAKAQAETKLAEVERSIQGARNFFLKKGNISNDIATEVRTEEFLRSSIDDQVSLPNVTMVGARAFSGLYLSRVDLPKATVIKQEAFRECNNLSYINIPMATTVELGAFENVYGYATMYVSEAVFEAFSRRSNEENLKFFSPHPWGADGDFTVEVISATTGRTVHIYRTVNNGYGGY